MIDFKIMIFFNVAVLILATISARKSYDGYTLLEIRPDTQSKIDYLISLESSNDPNIQIWRMGTMEISFDILISPESKRAFVNELEKKKIAYEIKAENIQEHIENEKKPHSVTRGPPTPNDANFAKYMNLQEINAFVEMLGKNYPDIVQIEQLGKSVESKPIFLVKVGSNTQPNKSSIWIDGGMHAREWIAVSTVAYILNKLVTGYNTDAKIKAYVDKLNWYIVPVLNVDGYHYSHTQDRMWRKNRRQAPCKFSACCDGVDINRNFGHNFGGDGTTQDSCQDSYRGSSAFSEPESKAIKDFVLEHTGDMKGFFSIHAYSQFWFYPYSHKRQSYPEDIDDLMSISKKAVDAMENLYGTQMKVGTAADILYPAAGGSIDWVKDYGKVKYTFALELRPGENATGNGFVLPTNNIVPAGEETWAALSVVADEIIRRYAN